MIDDESITSITYHDSFFMTRTMVVVVCKYCGNEFERPQSRETYRIKTKKDGPYCNGSCAAKGTSKFLPGVNNTEAILTEKDVKMIRARHKNGVTVRQLMTITGMSKNCIMSIIHRKSWTHLRDD